MTTTCHSFAEISKFEDVDYVHQGFIALAHVKQVAGRFSYLQQMGMKASGKAL